MPVPRVPGRHHAIEHIYPAQHGGDNVFRATNAHKVAGTVRGHVRDDGLEDAQTFLFRLADSQPPDREAGEIELHQ